MEETTTTTTTTTTTILMRLMQLYNAINAVVQNRYRVNSIPLLEVRKCSGI